jgi:hypothetical protein
MSLVMEIEGDETPLQAALRYARSYGLEIEVQEFYDKFVAEGCAEEVAAFDALYEWDLLDFKNDGAEGPSPAP